MVNNKDYSTALVGLLFVILGFYAAFSSSKINPNFITFITFAGFIVVLFDFISNSVSSTNKALVKYGLPLFIIISVAILCSINEGGLYGLINIKEATINSINNASTLFAFGLSLLILSNTFIKKSEPKDRVINTINSNTHNDSQPLPFKGYLQVTNPDKSDWFRNMYGKKLEYVNFPWPWLFRDFKPTPKAGDLFIIQEQSQIIVCIILEFNLTKNTNIIWEEHESKNTDCGFQTKDSLTIFVKGKNQVTNMKLKLISSEDTTFFDKFPNTTVDNLNRYGLKTYTITKQIESFMRDHRIKKLA